VNLLPCGENDGGLRVLPGSHKKHAEFFKNKGTMTADEARKYDVKGAPKTAADAENCTETFHWTQARSNWYVLDLKNSYDAKFVSQYSVDSNGHRGVKVCVEPGDMVFFHSRLFHQAWGIDNTKNTNPLAHRMVAYISMQPRSMATAKEIETRKKYAAACRTTSHWSALALSVNAEKPRIYGPADRHWIEDYNM
jgi:ectoine hydroxylase-related dioxygenase (phytanoyl-CoA dioxygenase family)